MKELFILEKKAIEIVGFRILCAGEDYIKEIPKASRRLQEIYPHEPVQIGAFVPGDCAEDKDGYWIGVNAASTSEVPEDMVTLTIRPQTYAVMTYEGPNHGIRNAYETFHSSLLKEGYERNMKAWHIEYFHRFENPDDIKVDLMETIWA